MTIRETCFIMPLCGLLILNAALLSGCEDTAARDRAQVQTQLEGAMQQFRSAEFGRVVSDLATVTGGEPGQQAARGLLLSGALRELGVEQLTQAEMHELEQHRDRNAVRAKLAGLLRLEANAAALAGGSTEPLRVDVHAHREALARQIRELNSQLAESEGPIAERKARIERDLREVERLRGQADELFHTAMDRGHADGLRSFKQAAALRREADQIERRIALVEIELSQDLQPQRLGATLALEHLAAMAESLQASLQELDAFDQLYQEEVSKLQRSAQELRLAINDAVRALGAASSGEIEPLYEQAVSQFERAASEASRAAAQVRTEGGAARLAEARAHEALGRAHWAHARGLADHAALLASLVGAGAAVGNVDGHATQLEATAAKQRETVRLAQSAYQAAIAAVEQAGRVQGAEGYRHSLQLAVDLLAGREVDLTPPAAPEIEMDFDVDLGEIDPAMLEGLAGLGDKEALLAMLDTMDFDTMVQVLEGRGMADPNMASMLLEPYDRAMAAIRARIESGEITDAAQLHEALMQEMMRAMSEGG